jgi:hypothetical protein
MSTKIRISWAGVLPEARAIVESYTTGVTLRQLFYRLVVAQVLPNLQTYYRRLSEYTAKARRQGTFPDLLDKTSRIERSLSFKSPAEAIGWLRDVYRRDRTEGQPWSIYLGVEKDGMSEQLRDWFGRPMGLPILALGGYASQTLVDKVKADIRRQKRPAVLLYGGDHDPTGPDILRDLKERVGLFEKVEHVALTPDQVDAYGLVSNPDPEVMKKLEDDPRARRFQEKYGDLVQYELDALPPDDLRDLYRNAIDGYWDEAALAAILAREKRDIAELARLERRGE